jgi:hypothetical protein
MYFPSLKYCESVTFIPRVLFDANQPLNYLISWYIYHPYPSLTMSFIFNKNSCLDQAIILLFTP